MYRIAETPNGFYVEKKILTTRFLRRPIEEWVSVDIYGSTQGFYPAPVPCFGKLSEAKLFIGKIKKGTIYHEVRD